MWKVILIASCVLFTVTHAETAAGYKKKLGLHSLRYTDYNYFNALDAKFVNSPGFKSAFRTFGSIMFDKILVLVIAIGNQIEKDPTLTHEDLMVPIEDLDTDNSSACIIKLKDEDACAEDNERARQRKAAALQEKTDHKSFCMNSENPARQNFIDRFSSNRCEESDDQTSKL